MPRPKGYRLNKAAFAYWREAEKYGSLTESAAVIGVPVPTLANLIAGASGASEKVVEQITARIGTVAAEMLFPERTGRFVALPSPVEDAA